MKRLRETKHRGTARAGPGRRALLPGLLLTGVLCPSLVASAQVWVGLGFDGISQAYYLVAVDTSFLSPDSLERLRRTALTQNEAHLSVRTRTGDALSWDQTTAATSLAWHHRSAVRLASDRGRVMRGSMEYRLDWKVPHEASEANALSDFVVHEAVLDAQRRFGSLAAGLAASGEWVHYPTADFLALDYGLYRGALRLRRQSGLSATQELRLQLGRRIVRDSARASYWDAAGRLALAWTLAQWRFGLHLEAADRRYGQSANLEFGVARARFDWRSGALRARWSGSLEVEGYNYYGAAHSISDFARLLVRPRVAAPWGDHWTPYLEPRLEVVLADAEGIDESFFEPRLLVGTDFFSLDGWWANADVGLGRRDYRGPSGLTDYWRVGLNLLVDGRLWRGVSLHLIYSQDWEWHAEQADDVTVRLLSAGLRYRL